jgi:hypothetical protein
MTHTSAHECQQTGKLITSLMLDLAKEVSSAGSVSLSDLARIARIIETMDPLFEMAKGRCRKSTACKSIHYRRTQLLGRILAQPLESLLYACPPLLDRTLLTPLFSAIARMIGEAAYGSFEEEARRLYFSMLAKTDHFEWEPYYGHEEAMTLYCRVFAKLATAFCAYNDAKKDFIGQMRVATQTSFGFDEYFTLLGAIARPLQLPGEVSRHRGHMEVFLPRSERKAIDNFITVFTQDRLNWKSLAPMRRRIAAA